MEDLTKKAYISPELQYNSFQLNNLICSSPMSITIEEDDEGYVPGWY